MKALQRLAMLALLAPAASQALAQAYPSQVIRLINPYAAGGPADLLAREIATGLAEALGQQIVIENKPGAGSTIGAEFVARARPDGYTLLLSGAPSHVIVPAMQAKPLYDGINDFTPVCMFATVPNVIVANPARPYTTLAELIAYAKANPGKVTYGSAGNGSIGHLATELLGRRAGVSLVHVPYKGGAPAVADPLGGQSELAVLQVSAVMPHIKSGRLRALAIATKERSQMLPDLPSVHESGLTGFDAGTWWGLFGPANLPRAIVATLYQAMTKVMSSAELKVRLLQQQGAETTLRGPEELAAQLREDYSTLTTLIKSAGLKME